MHDCRFALEKIARERCFARTVWSGNDDTTRVYLVTVEALAKPD
jgi:hypothetical protein